MVRFLFVEIVRSAVFLIIEVKYSRFNVLGESNPHVDHLHVLPLLGIDIPATFTKTVMLGITLMAEQLQVVYKICIFIRCEGLQIVLFCFSWLSFEVVVQYDAFVVADYEVAVRDGE